MLSRRVSKPLLPLPSLNRSHTHPLLRVSLARKKFREGIQGLLIDETRDFANLLLPAFVCHLSTAQFIRASSTSPGGPTAGARPVAFPLHFTAACHRRSGIFFFPPHPRRFRSASARKSPGFCSRAASLTTFAFRGGLRDTAPTPDNSQSYVRAGAEPWQAALAG